MPEINTDEISFAVKAEGLIPFGWLVPSLEDLSSSPFEIPQERALLLLGNAGGAMWRSFASEARENNSSLDQWSRRTIDKLAKEFGAQALYPFDKPHLPFQRWAIRSGLFFNSPLGLTIHNRFGLWHGFRGALLFPFKVQMPPTRKQISPCDTCKTRPCLSACPVEAFTMRGYNVPACVEHLKQADSKNCLQSACAARRACPVGVDFIYEGEQAEFHMNSFLRTFT